MDKKKIAQLIIARLDGDEIGRRFRYYQSLVGQGIGGFIIFGGEAGEVRDGIRRLQKDAEYPLFIASDLEQGLGQQIKGGTIFPPAMAIASAIDKDSKDDVRLLRRSIDIVATEAKAVGINVVLAPVADVNTNPKNPIICTRSFSNNPGTVAWFVKEYVKGIQRYGLIACTKHFPGHGDTAIDSHLEMPIVKADMKRLRDVELYPFSRAINAGVRMIMIGHLKVPAIDRRFLATFSKKTIDGLLRGGMGFNGLLTTDAMTMKAVSMWGNEAYLMALRAGVDILLHPEDPNELIEYLNKHSDRIIPHIKRSFVRILKEKKRLSKTIRQTGIRTIGSRKNMDVAERLTEKAIKIDTVSMPSSRIRPRFIIVIDDDNRKSYKTFVSKIKSNYRKAKVIYIDNNYKGDEGSLMREIADSTTILGVFSTISAYKGRSVLSRRLMPVLKKAINASAYSIVTGFCCPYILKDIKADMVINAYSDTDTAQECSARLIHKSLIR